VVTNGAGTSTQQTNLLGSFADPNAAGWQAWHWIPLRDASGNPAVVTLGGVETLHVNGGGNLNANYYMLVPAPAATGQVHLSVSLNGSRQPAISFASQSGHTYTLVYKNSLTDAAWTSLNSVAGDGTVLTLTDATTAGAAHRYYAVQIQ
jgi:hypothetical protein